MKALFVGFVAVVCVVSASPASAQRGGGRGGRGAGDTPAASTSFDSKEFAIAFAVPPGLVLYTPEAPGRYGASLTDRRIALLVNPLQAADVVSIKYADGMTEADLKGYLTTLETNPPQARLPGYEKVTLASSKVGKDGTKDAIDFVYKVKQNGADMTLRQIVFIHSGRGFTVLCSAEKKNFEQVNRALFSKLLSQIEFR